MLPPEDWQWLNDLVDMSRSRFDPLTAVEIPVEFAAYRAKYRKQQARFPLPVVHEWGSTRRQAVKVWGDIQARDLLDRLQGMPDRVSIPAHVGKLSEQPPLSWTKGNDGITVICPNGHIGRLDHDVNAQGEVNPSLDCPGRPAAGSWPESPCDFHVWARLEDWGGVIRCH